MVITIYIQLILNRDNPIGVNNFYYWTESVTFKISTWKNFYFAECYQTATKRNLSGMIAFKENLI